MAGILIVFEGPEGAGKSTQVVLQAARLRAAGLDVVTTREPGGTEIGESIRSILLAPYGPSMLPETEAFLYAAARSEHVAKVIGPALERGSVVLCDRFVDSSLAYQGGGHGLPIDAVAAIQSMALRGISPALRILLDLPAETGLARRLGDDSDVNRLDMAGVAFHRRVRQTYHQLVAADPERWVVVDGRSSPQDVEAEIAGAIDRLIRQTNGSAV